MSDTVLIIIRWAAYITAGVVWLSIALIVLSLLWASWRQKRQERRERKAISTSDLKESLDRRTNDLLTKYMDLDARVNQLEQARHDARMDAMQKQVLTPEAKPCSPKSKRH